VGVLDAAFDVLVPEFGIEKRVHVDQMPIDVSVCVCCFFIVNLFWATRTTFTMSILIRSRFTGPTEM
jgi:protein SSD1